MPDHSPAYHFARHLRRAHRLYRLGRPWTAKHHLIICCGILDTWHAAIPYRAVRRYACLLNKIYT